MRVNLSTEIEIRSVRFDFSNAWATVEVHAKLHPLIKTERGGDFHFSVPMRPEIMALIQQYLEEDIGFTLAKEQQRYEPPKEFTPSYDPNDWPPRPPQ